MYERLKQRTYDENDNVKTDNVNFVTPTCIPVNHSFHIAN